MPGMPEHFENGAGTYDLLTMERGRVRYRFLGRSGKAVLADVPEAVWRRMASQEGTAAGEGADARKGFTINV